MKRYAVMIVATISAHITGNAILVLSLINLVWMLVKDTQLFSWWYVGYSAIAFIVSVFALLIALTFINN